ncbi:MAG: hypothetical protein QOE65_1310 [Solirubrobacteraceae bacterium]|jgi:hypothetical protein|nr:hypothetical protein [Solirubrobacteraceae bacterium]
MDTPQTPEDADEAMRPLREAGQGEAEGFEVAEADLIENATHGDDAGEGIPRLEKLGDEEAEPDVAQYGEPDEEEPRDL